MIENMPNHRESQKCVEMWQASISHWKNRLSSLHWKLFCKLLLYCTVSIPVKFGEMTKFESKLWSRRKRWLNVMNEDDAIRFAHTTFVFSKHCNCKYILFTKLPWPENSEGTFWLSSQCTTCVQDHLEGSRGVQWPRGPWTLGDPMKDPMGFRKAVGISGHSREPMSSRGVHQNNTEKSACEAWRPFFFGDHQILNPEKPLEFRWRPFFFGDHIIIRTKLRHFLHLFWSSQNRKSVIFELASGRRSALSAPACVPHTVEDSLCSFWCCT